jgi:hypothetical protein
LRQIRTAAGFPGILQGRPGIGIPARKLVETVSDAPAAPP